MWWGIYRSVGTPPHLLYITVLCIADPLPRLYMHTHHNHRKPRVLFILKLRQTSGGTYTILKSSGLLNSATFCKDMLINNDYEAKLVEVVDNNSIDREVTLYRPDVVVIEALWVVPEKFNVLRRLHPDVKWIVRVHSEIPFLAGEGHAMDWINAYITKRNVFVSFNSAQTHSDFVDYFTTRDPSGHLVKKLIFLPNYYPVSDSTVHNVPSRRVLNVGCFGAVRLMKNALTQAFAAIKYADSVGKKCRFHINSGRVEHGMSSLVNLRGLFDSLHGKHELVEHDWLDRDAFLALVRTMDIGVQMSFSESFNIVAADFVSEGIPMIVSPEIDWVPEFFMAVATDIDDTAAAMKRVMLYNKFLYWTKWEKSSLKKYVDNAERIWLYNFIVLEHGHTRFSEACAQDIVKESY